MRKQRWEKFVEREYLDTDYDFVEQVLPHGTVDGSSFGLISDATKYELAQGEKEVHIKPRVSSLDSILESLRKGGVSVDKKDAQASVERFAELWEERIMSKGKWEKMIELAQEEGAIRTEAESKKGWLGRLARPLKKKRK